MIKRLSRPIPSDNRRSDFGSQAYFLKQDFGHKVVPHLHRGDAYRLTVSGIPHQILYGSLTIGQNRPGLRGFIRAVASHLFIDSEVWLEVAFDSVEESTTQF